MAFTTRLVRSRNTNNTHLDPDMDDIPSELMQNAAQASRLRRRGAIRSGGRTDLFPSGSHYLGRENPDCLLVSSLRGANDRHGVRRVICGGPEEVEEEDTSDQESDSGSYYSPTNASPYRTSPLPSTIDLRTVPTRAAPPRKSGRSHTQNGCGAILHYSALSVPRMRSCAALIEPDDEDAAIGGLPEHTYPVPKSKSMCKCTRERVGCLRCGNEVGVRYRPCAMHMFRIDRASVLFNPKHTHLDEPFSELETHADDSDSDSFMSTSAGGTNMGTGLHSVINTLSALVGQQQRQPLRSPPPVPTPLRAGLSPMLALSELPWIQEPNALPATGANATPLSPVSLTLALRRPLRGDGDEPSTPLDVDIAESDTGRRTPVPARRNAPNPQNYQAYPPFTQHPPAQYPPAQYQPPQSQLWRQATPQPPPHLSGNLQVPHNGLPFLPPKPEINTSNNGPPWIDRGNQVSSPFGIAPDISRQWAPSPVPSGAMADHRAHSLPPQSAIPRMGHMFPPEHVRMLDGGKPEVAIPHASQYHISPTTYQNPFSPAMSNASLSPRAYVGSPMSTSSHSGSLPPSTPAMNTSTLLASPSELPPRPPSQLPFTPPPPPPPLLNRGTTPGPAHHSLPVPISQPQPMAPPPMPTHYSEPHLHMYYNHSPVQTRHTSLPVFSPGPTTIPTTPTPAPSFPVPTIGAPVSLRTESTGNWVGGIVPRSSMHFRAPFQPDWNNMPSIPQAQTPQPPLPPPPSHAPPPPPVLPPPPPGGAPYVSALRIPAPPPVPPPPPPPKHTVTSPTILTHGPWSDGLNFEGPPLPTKDQNAPINELPLPPKVPVLPPKDFQPVLPVTNSPAPIDQEAELREALQRSLSEVSSTPDEERDLQAAMYESMREMSMGHNVLGADSELLSGSSLNEGSGAWTPVLRSSSPEEVGATYARKPPPPLPISAIPTPNQISLPHGEMASNSTDDSSAGIVIPSMSLSLDEPPPPTYEEVTGSATHSPALPIESIEPIPVDHASTSSSPAPLFGHPRSPAVQPGNNQGIRSPSIEAEVPIIEVVPPSHHNSLSRPQRQQDEALSRTSSVSPPTQTRPRVASQAHPAADLLPHHEPELTTVSKRQRVLSVSHALGQSSSRLSRASVFFGMSSSTTNLAEGPPNRTWAIDEESPGSSGGLLLQPPQPSSSTLGRLHSRNASKSNLQETPADAPPVETLLHGISYGFRDPDPPTPVSMPPASPLPPSIMIGKNDAFHVQAPNFRHLLRLLSHYGSTSIMATPAAIASSKSGTHSLRVALYFVRGNHDRDPWLCRLFLELHTPDDKETTTTVPDTSLLWSDSSFTAPCGPRGKLYVLPGPLPILPLPFQTLSSFIVKRLDEACHSSNDSIKRLERILIECYGSVGGASNSAEEIGGRQKGSGNISFGGLFSRVKDKFSSDRGGTMNDHTYDLISPFQIDEYQ
ncbi:Formin-like protein 5 [Rhizoctonia solani]|uniref:Formin-like protein 5 n=1 Tax=Rhizoctonia solani TaxID=456999 RepID=A0A8H8NUD4_9AGAM|nr:Formin-like protein 5 [Rhizoctonia solani]QRW19505.1 Formin-like protein 5 [Rhizoctonia solani]